MKYIRRPLSSYYDAIIIGAGIVGLSIAKELKKQERDISILIVEKEHSFGLHASGRNSGVLHSGIYYPSKSIKSATCLSGGKRMAAYCHEHNLPINYIGKVIIPVSEKDDKQIDLLYARANNKNINACIINEKELHEVEPEAYSISGRALYSPNTAIISPLSIMEQIVKDLDNAGVTISTGHSISKFYPDESLIALNGKKIKYGRLFNAAGLYADKISHTFSAGKEFTIIPFKGSYYQLKKNCGISMQKLIYPVPNSDYPFLGIHSVTTINGNILFGPNSIPAFGRENYKMLESISPIELISIGYHLLNQYISSDQFRDFSHSELLKIFKKNFISSVNSIVPRVRQKHLVKAEKVGIRAQLYNTKHKKLEMDFIIKKIDNTVHVLNSVSPAFTSAFSMAEEIVEKN